MSKLDALLKLHQDTKNKILTVSTGASDQKKRRNPLWIPPRFILENTPTQTFR